MILTNVLVVPECVRLETGLNRHLFALQGPIENRTNSGLRAHPHTNIYTNIPIYQYTNIPVYQYTNLSFFLSLSLSLSFILNKIKNHYSVKNKRSTMSNILCFKL
ncbi:MAG: hypothetical protein AMS27_09250 [Bacteroides sp. SM23_62_1]|nr:MAG: hypothetical protein AMS27_09250 [Bacteroides sp. SM23_62_1]